MTTTNPHPRKVYRLNKYIRLTRKGWRALGEQKIRRLARQHQGITEQCEERQR